MAESVTRITNPLTILLWLRLQERKGCGDWEVEIYAALKWSRDNPSLAKIKESLAELVEKGYATVQRIKRDTCTLVDVHFPTEVQVYIDVVSPEQTETKENDD